MSVASKKNRLGYSPHHCLSHLVCYLPHHLRKSLLTDYYSVRSDPIQSAQQQRNRMQLRAHRLAHSYTNIVIHFFLIYIFFESIQTNHPSTLSLSYRHAHRIHTPHQLGAQRCNSFDLHQPPRKSQPACTHDGARQSNNRVHNASNKQVSTTFNTCNLTALTNNHYMLCRFKNGSAPCVMTQRQPRSRTKERGSKDPNKANHLKLRIASKRFGHNDSKMPQSATLKPNGARAQTVGSAMKTRSQIEMEPSDQRIKHADNKD